jgi:hypothetical protein
MRYIFLFTALFMLLISCDNHFRTVEGNGVSESREKTVARFSKLEVSGSFKVIIVPSGEHKVVVEADENLHDYIRIEEDDNRVKIKMKNNVRIKNPRSIKLTVYMQDVNKIELAGSVNLKSEGVLEHSDKLELTIAGSGDADIEVKSPEVKISIGGAGKVLAAGKTRNLNISIAGSGDYLGEDLMSEYVDLSIAGSGSAKVYASMGLEVSVAGSGNVYYAGNPEKVKKSIAGAGFVKPISASQ